MILYPTFVKLLEGLHPKFEQLIAMPHIEWRLLLFKLAREATGKTTASYKVGDDSRKGLMLESRIPRSVRDRQGTHQGNGLSICRRNRSERSDFSLRFIALSP